MSYNAIAAAAQDANLRLALASVHMWRIVANGPIADAYSYAVAANVPNPGKDEAVVTDANILAAVTAIVAADTPE